MITVVIGGSGSGKSDYAEALLDDFSGQKYYVATMQIYDDEMRRKVERHRMRRSNKGFETIEQHKDIAGVISVIAETDRSGMKAVLIECISNLVANEMFADNVDNNDSGNENRIDITDRTDTEDRTDTADKILSEIKQVAEVVDELVIVTNNVAEDGIDYDSTTLEYIRTISDVNIGLSQMADKVVEVVVGIPIIVKEERTCQ